MKNFFLSLFESQNTKTLKSCMKNGYIKTLESEESLKDLIKKEIKKVNFQPFHILHKDKKNNKLTKVVIFKDGEGKFKTFIQELR